MQTQAKSEQKTYRKGSSLYFSAGLVLSMVLVVTAFEWKTAYNILADPIDFPAHPEEEEVIFVPVTLPAPPPPKLAQAPRIVEVPDDVVTAPTILEPPVELDEPTTPSDDLLAGLVSAGGPGETPVEVAEMASKAAVPANGFAAFHKYILEGLSIPDYLLSRNKEAKVQVSFVIDTDGTLTDIRIVKGFDQQLEKQIIRLLEDAPAWEPAIQNGRRVKMRMQLPITIQITH